MFFIARYQCDTAGFDRLPLTVAENFTVARVKEYLMFPFMRVLWSMSVGGNLKNSHAKIVRAVVPADHNPSRDSLRFFIIKMSRFNIGILYDLHGTSSFIKNDTLSYREDTTVVSFKR